MSLRQAQRQRFKKGGSYDGLYVDNQKDGEGTFTAPDGSKYVGQWKADKRHGTGTYYYANGDRYVGLSYYDY